MLFVLGQHTNNPTLIYSTNKDIRITTKTKGTITLVQNFNEGPAIDYHYEQQKLCWTNHDLEAILCDDFDGVATKNKVQKTLIITSVHCNKKRKKNTTEDAITFLRMSYSNPIF